MHYVQVLTTIILRIWYRFNPPSVEKATATIAKAAKKLDNTAAFHSRRADKMRAAATAAAAAANSAEQTASKAERVNRRMAELLA